MLVFQRKVGEQIRIGDGVVVTVLRTSDGRVSLGIAAPEACRIRRSELAAALADGPTPPRPVSDRPPGRAA